MPILNDRCESGSESFDAVRARNQNNKIGRILIPEQHRMRGERLFIETLQGVRVGDHLQSGRPGTVGKQLAGVCKGVLKKGGLVH